MNIGCIVSSIGCLFFLMLALIFTLLKDRGAVLISGFNSLSEKERESYDKAKMSQDQRNLFLIWAVIWGIGAILSYLFTQYIAIIACIIWLIIFFRDVHFDEEKAFGKYKK